ncbi:DUF1080 domain-containing protein [Seonamhaeicola sp.]|uniref:3-keto-disaccharide hydrolase n=1 Tax=Seonamhaeicola sp. TaxID=1912245 RepID=UPI00262CBB5E|nr:DUF1080 domain-containing protein [Seonamhaeicola sp.]
MKQGKLKICSIGLILFGVLFVGCKSDKKVPVEKTEPIDKIIGDWASFLPSGHSIWMTFYKKDGELTGEMWNVGMRRNIEGPTIKNDTLFFKRQMKVGKPNYIGGPPTGDKILVDHKAYVKADRLHLIMNIPQDQGKTKVAEFIAKPLPQLPIKPDLSKVTFGDPIVLFNGKDLEGWKLTNENQKNGWSAKHGELVNDTPKRSFDPFSNYGNLRTIQEFNDFNLQIEFNVPKGGNSGIYLQGRYEAQVVDRDSKMQGKIGVGSIFSRIKPSENVGLEGGNWQKYDITLVNRHITIVLNGQKVIDNEPLIGPTQGALNADVTKPGPIYLQGDHTLVKYRNIILKPIQYTDI